MPKQEMQEVKYEIEQEIRGRIDAGDAISGEILPKNPRKILVIGKTEMNMQVTVIYDGHAPYTFRVTKEW